MSETIPDEQQPSLVEVQAQLNPDKPVAIGKERTLTWSKLHERCRALAQGLYGLGLRPGDKATVMIYNLPEYVEIISAFSLIRVGLVMVGYRNKPPEIEYITNNSDAKCLIFYHEFADRILPHRKRYTGLLPQGFVSIGSTSLDGAVDYEGLIANPPDVDLENLPPEQGTGMIYTSGTTGKPKGAARKGGAEKLAEFALHIIAQFKYQPDEAHLVACPLYHSAPYVFASCAFVLGGTLILMPRFDPLEFLENVARYGVNSSFVVPTILDSLLQVPAEVTDRLDLSSLRALICGGAPLFPQTKLGILDRFGPVLYEFYGATETGVNIVITPEEIRERPTSVGKPFFDNEFKILDGNGNEVEDGERGELYIYNSFLMEGYYKNEEATREVFREKYMTVGDIAIRDKDGYYYIVDRVTDMIIRGGVNVYPAEVEEALHKMPGIKDTAVVGKPDSHWGEIVTAFIVLEPDDEINEEMIKDFLSEQLANHKIPEIIVFKDEIPRTPTGKTLKKDLKAELINE
ncbi:MAG: acyl--CoA ligase [Deltaproteobacteria bacterium]|nr:acyl--CoA ligase [Deltaproteobacteria bacterium]MBW2085662.1 acyl--CoA ligase [Deltaproteobacteria bacterium]